VSDKSNLKKRVGPVVVMLLITLVFISITTSLYTFTREKVLLNESLVLKKAVLSSSGMEFPEDPQEIEKLYSEKVREVRSEDGTVIYYAIIESDPSYPISYVFIQRGSGLWGTITIAIGYDPAIDRIMGFEVIDQNETPGLGGRITEAWFMEQFRGKRAPIKTVPEGTQAGENEIDAITGATTSSNAIRDIVNAATEKAKAIMKKSGA
jgi:Na+-transporting NADH:ubiquinone oxidoreductase subunit C